MITRGSNKKIVIPDKENQLEIKAKPKPLKKTITKPKTKIVEEPEDDEDETYLTPNEDEESEIENNNDFEDDDNNEEPEEDNDDNEDDDNNEEPEEDNDDNEDDDNEEEPDEDDELELPKKKPTKPVKSIKKAKKAEVEEEEEKPKKKNSKKAKKVEEEEEDIPLKDKKPKKETPAREILNNIGEETIGPEKFRRLYDERYADTETISTRSASNLENMNSFISRLNENGFSFVFEGCKNLEEKRKIANAILQSLEQAILDCLFIKGTGFAILNSRIDATKTEGKVYKVMGPMTNPALKEEHYRLSLNTADFSKDSGLIYRTNNISELSIPVEETDDGKFKALKSGVTIKKGDIVNSKGKKFKKKK